MPDIVFSLTVPQAQRLATAFGARQGLGRDATLAEIKQWLLGHLKEMVRSQEKAVSEAMIVIPPFEPS
jgi:hypothetical protein